MLDRPDAAELLRAMATCLSKEVVPATRGGARHAARVVANLCGILEREVRDGGEARETTRRSLVELLDRDAPLEDLVAALDARLAADPEDLDFDRRARRRVLEDVRRRLAIDRPDYEA